LYLRRPLTALASAALTAVSAAVIPLTTASPASAETVDLCQPEYEAQIVFWAMTCSAPSQQVIGAFATWKNAPITFSKGATPGVTVQASNYVRMTPNTEKSPFANNITVGLYAQKTGANTSSYGPRWTELGNHGGKTQAITVGVNPSSADGRNHTYMTVRQDHGDQWDVLYDFNKVGSTTDQLKVPEGNGHRVVMGLEVMGPQYVNVSQFADRMQFMDVNKTWNRVQPSQGGTVSKVISLGVCGKERKAPYCFTARMTGGDYFTQWTVSKPGPTTAAAPQTTILPMTPSKVGDEPQTFNGVDQQALQQCLAQDPDTCLSTVPGLADCVVTARMCNAAGLQSNEVFAARSETESMDRDSIRDLAAASFSVTPEDVTFTNAASPRSAADADGAVWTVTSSQSTPGLESGAGIYHGFRATYSARTGQLLEACWGDMCRS
jgi:hypothetical protein